MNHWQKNIRLLATMALFTVAFSQTSIRAQTESSPDVVEASSVEEAEGLADLDEAIRMRATSKGIRDLNKAIELLETALDKGLEVEDNDFAEQMLSDSLMERASTFMQVINTRPIDDQQVQRIRQLVISDLRSVLDFDDPPPNAHLMLAKLMLLPGGDPREARRAVRNYLKIEELPDERRAEALVLRARLSKDKSKALVDMDKAIELAPENAAYRLAKALFLRQANKLDDALKAIQEVIQLNPTNANAVILQGEIYRQQKRLKEALASYDQAAELVPQAPDPYQYRGIIYYEQEKYELSIAQFTKVLELQPGALQTLVMRAEAYLANEQYESALADIEVVIEKQPLIAAHQLRARILDKMDRLGEAIEEIQRVVDAMPEQVEMGMQLALYHKVDKQPLRAIEAYSGVLEQGPDNLPALQSRADLYLNAGQHAEAIADFNRALKLKPDDTAILNNLAWVLATSPDEPLRDGKRALELATKACELTDYKTPHILSTLAAAFAENGDFEDAIKWSQQAVDLDDPEHGVQLKKELESYREGQPWRERQSLEEKQEPDEPLTDTPQGPLSNSVPVR